jgi:hypothetical protein
MVLVALLLALVDAFPSPTKTAWMSPESFHVSVGMQKKKVVAQLTGAGWKPHKGKAPNHLLIDVEQTKTVTLEFQRDRLHSIRFELFDFLPDVTAAFKEASEALVKRYGPPKPGMKSKSIVIYEKTRPNIIVVLSTDPKTTAGKQGLGFMTVRYFESPPAE